MLVMSASDLKNWMQQTGTNVQDIAYALQIHPNTVYRFLQGKPVQRSTKRALESLPSMEWGAKRKLAVG
jgi:hypothetical protein